MFFSPYYFPNRGRAPMERSCERLVELRYLQTSNIILGLLKIQQKSTSLGVKASAFFVDRANVLGGAFPRGQPSRFVQHAVHVRLSWVTAFDKRLARWPPESYGDRVAESVTQNAVVATGNMGEFRTCGSSPYLGEPCCARFQR
jgi:hypothetical protein